MQHKLFADPTSATYLNEFSQSLAPRPTISREREADRAIAVLGANTVPILKGTAKGFGLNMERVVNETQATSLLYIAETDASGYGSNNSHYFPELVQQTGLNLALTHCSSLEAVPICSTQHFDLVVVNHQPNYLDAISLGAELRKNSHHQFTPMLLLTSQGSEQLAANAFKSGFGDYLNTAGLSVQTVSQSITQALLTSRLHEELDASRHAMMQYNHELERRHYLFSKYWDDVSHTLLTPLASVQEFVSLVMDEVPGSINTEQGKYLALARGSCKKLAMEIAQLAQISELGSAVNLPTANSQCLITILADVIKDISLDAQLQNVCITTSYANNLPTVVVDKYRFSQALQSLLLRCICLAGQQGEIEVTAQENATRPGYVNVVLQVFETDETQIGLNPETFRDLANGNAIVAMHGGELTVSHLPDGTTEFRFQLPASNDKPNASLQPAA